MSIIKGKTLVPPLNVENYLTKSPYLHNKAIHCNMGGACMLFGFSVLFSPPAL